MINLQIFRWRGLIYNDVGELVRMVVAEDDGEDGGEDDGEDGVGVVSVATLAKSLVAPTMQRGLHHQLHHWAITKVQCIGIL